MPFKDNDEKLPDATPESEINGDMQSSKWNKIKPNRRTMNNNNNVNVCPQTN